MPDSDPLAALREEGVLTHVELPDGSGSGGLMVDGEDGCRVALFARPDLEEGDTLVAAGRRLRVASIEVKTLDGRRVTLVEARP